MNKDEASILGPAVVIGANPDVSVMTQSEADRWAVLAPEQDPQ